MTVNADAGERIIPGGTFFKVEKLLPEEAQSRQEKQQEGGLTLLLPATSQLQMAPKHHRSTGYEMQESTYA